MNERQLHALLLSGDELMFLEGSTTLRDYLMDDVGIPRDRVNYVPFSQNLRFVAKEVGGFFDRLPKDAKIDVFIGYSGHGDPGVFYPNGQRLSYEDFARLINNNGRFIFLNDSCYSGSSVAAFTNMGLLPERGMLLAASGDNERAHDYLFTEAVIESFRNRRPFRKKTITETLEGSEEQITYDPNQKDIRLWVVSDGREIQVELPANRFGSIPNEDQRKPSHIQRPVRTGISLDRLLYPIRTRTSP